MVTRLACGILMALGAACVMLMIGCAQEKAETRCLEELVFVGLRKSHWKYFVVVELRPGVTSKDAEAEIERYLRNEPGARQPRVPTDCQPFRPRDFWAGVLADLRGAPYALDPYDSEEKRERIIADLLAEDPGEAEPSGKPSENP